MRPKSKSTVQPPGSKVSKIYWEKGYFHHTGFFIEWCQDSPTKCVRLFSNSTQDARKEDCMRVQLNTAKKNSYFKLAKYIFEHDTELTKPQLQPSAAILHTLFSLYLRFSNIVTCLCSLRAQYHEQVKHLGQTDEGLMINDLQRADRTKGLLGLYHFFYHISDSWLAGKIFQDFPWFSALHSWWQSNPMYNMAFSTADTNQDFVVEATTLFKLQPDFPMDVDSLLSPYLLTTLLPAH